MMGIAPRPDPPCPDSGTPPMPSRRDLLALPPPGTRALAVPRPPAYGLSSVPPEESSVLWAVARRHWPALLLAAVVCGGAAWAAGQYLGKPQWQAEATLLYQLPALSEKQHIAYEHP